MRVWAGAALLAAVVTGAGLAFADTPPSAWEVARDPAALERYRLHEHVQEEINPPLEIRPEMSTVLYEAARAQLEAASAATSPDVRLRFDLGEIYEELGRHQEAFDVLRPALTMAPSHSAAPNAWRSFAFAAAHLDRSVEELEGYDHFIAASTFDSVTVRANRAEAEMRLGNLDEAVAGYRDVIDRIEHGRVASGNALQEIALARWGLAVALDRLGDRTASDEVIHIVATLEDPREQFIGDHEAVFFVPDYERDWYYALGRAEHARLETDPKRALAMWSLVVENWVDYVDRASRQKPPERWLPLARAHLSSAEAARALAATRVPAPTMAPAHMPPHHTGPSRRGVGAP